MSRRLRASVSFTYLTDPESYGFTSARAIAAIDQEEFRNDPGLLLEIFENVDDIEITVEPAALYAADLLDSWDDPFEDEEDD